MHRTFINKKYSFDEIAEWYQDKIKIIPHDPNELGNEGYITEKELLELFTGRYFIQEKLRGKVAIKGREGFEYHIYYDSDMSHPVEKVKVGRNNVRYFTEFTRNNPEKTTMIIYSEYSEKAKPLDKIYEILNRYLENPSLHNDNEKVGIVVKNYGDAGKYVFGEYSKH